MSVGQGDSFQVERIAALSPLDRIERAAGFADSRNRRRPPPPAPDEDETDADADDAPQDVIAWSAALKADAAPPAVSPFPAPALPSPASESRRLDLTV